MTALLKRFPCKCRDALYDVPRYKRLEKNGRVSLFCKKGPADDGLAVFSIRRRIFNAVFLEDRQAPEHARSSPAPKYSVKPSTAQAVEFPRPGSNRSAPSRSAGKILFPYPHRAGSRVRSIRRRSRNTLFRKLS